MDFERYNNRLREMINEAIDLNKSHNIKISIAAETQTEILLYNIDKPVYIINDKAKHFRRYNNEVYIIMNPLHF